MGYKITEKGKKWIGVEYESGEYSDVLKKAVMEFNKSFCLNDMEKTHISCLERDEHDGHIDEKTDIEYAVGLYHMGGDEEIETKKGTTETIGINIGLITDGKCNLGWFLPDHEKYEDGLHLSRQFGFALDELPIECLGVEIREELLKPKKRK